MKAMPESLEASHVDHFKNDQQIALSKALRHLAIVLFSLLTVTTFALIFVPWQQTSMGSGRLVAYSPLDRQQTIEAPIEGRITAWHVREGSHVEAGDPILEIADNDPQILHRLGQEREAVVARIEAAQARAKSVESRIRALGASRSSGVNAAGSRASMAVERVESARRLVEASQAIHKTAELNLERQTTLFKEGLTSKRNLELAELELTRNQKELERSQVALNAAISEELALRSDQSRFSTDASAAIDDAHAARAVAASEIAASNAELSRIEVRLARQNAQSVKAPRAGVILNLVSSEGGDMVKAGDPLAVLVPDTVNRAVELWIEGNDMPLLHKGQSVRLQFEGWPAVQFSGWPSVAVGTFGGRIALIDPSGNSTGKFRILVAPVADEPWPQPQYLRQGVRTNGWVLMSRVRLGYELWRQFNAFPLSTPTPPPAASGQKEDAGKGASKKP